MKNIVNSNMYLIHCLCNNITMTLTFATNVACNLSNATINDFSSKCRL